MRIGLQDVALTHRFMLGAGTLFVAGIVMLVLITGVLVFQYREAADYPGAQLISDHTNYKLGPHPTIRRDTSYRSQDVFTRIYNWYSIGFNMGSEAKANGGCILLESASRGFVFDQQITVFICESTNGRLIYVTRFATLAIG